MLFSCRLIVLMCRLLSVVRSGRFVMVVRLFLSGSLLRVRSRLRRFLRLMMLRGGMLRLLIGLLGSRVVCMLVMCVL